MKPETRDYADKRSFDATPEPAAAVEGSVDVATAPPGPSFVVHQHHATRLHFDLRLEMRNGEVPVLVSWAIPKNLPTKTGRAHLAVHVEDHPFDYGSFEGTIPKGNYGAGEVRIFDSGTYEMLEQEPGKLTFRLHGRRLQGIYHMILPKKNEGSNDWLVFLKKQERPEPEAPPELSPMLATLAQEAFDDEAWLFEPKWDGVRALAVCSDTTMLVSRSKKDMTAAYPELHGLHDRLVALDAIVDGEIVAFQEGRPSFEKLQSRINLQNQQDIKRAVKAIPVSYIAFDLIYLDGKSLVQEPVESRKELLEKVVVPSATVQVSSAVARDGVALADAARRQNLEGIVAKKLGSPYRPGKRTREWLKVKVTFEADVVIGGWSAGEGARSDSFGALLAGAYTDEGLRFVGAVGTGYSQQRLDELVALLGACATDECPFLEDPGTLVRSAFGKALRNARWTEPLLVATVEFRELTSQGRLRAPSFKGIRTDADPEACTFEALMEAAGLSR
jgi:bifunctional non-homologous end joining protein LigD